MKGKISSGNRHTESTEREAQTENNKELPSSPPKKKGRVTAASQDGAFSLCPPGSNCLFSSLNVLSLRYHGVAAVEEMPATVPVLVEIFLFLLELAPAVKMPEAVVLPVSPCPRSGDTAVRAC